MTSLAVCDTCRSRKVRCDRDDPCGNCVDSNIPCSRTVSAGRSVSKRRSGPETIATPQSIQRHGLQTTFTPSPPKSTSVPQSPSIIEAHEFIRREITSGESMPADRLAVLNAAMSFVHHLSQTVRHENLIGGRSTRVVDVLEGITTPPVELLYWMLRELKGRTIGPHVLDYFKHVSLKSLKTMGLTLINRAGDSETLLLYSICVNSAIFKFINTVLSESDMGGIEYGLRDQAGKYLQSVELAMTRIHLLAAPSLLLLQSLLCSAFIAQGQGDSVRCWAFISAACKTCEDLNLEAQVSACQSETEDDIELYYCYVWCHILDKNYSMMLGRTRCLLNHEGLDSVFSSPLNRSLSALLSTYLLFVPVQAIFILELHPHKISNKKALFSRVESMVADLLNRLQRVHTRITELHGPSDSWGGLHMGTELTTIEFSYHSLRTSILRSKQICLPAQPYADHDCLESARMAMSTLRSIQEAATTLIDIRSHVAYMHWTVLYHPLTPFFVLYRNVVATSDSGDFHTLKRVTEELEGLAEFSASIAKLQTLFKSFIELCDGLVPEKRQKTAEQVDDTRSQRDRVQQPVNRALQSQGAGLTADFSTLLAPSEFYSPMQPTSAPSLLPDNIFTFSVEGTSGAVDPGWGLYDVQPTLNWLDADFSFFDSEQYQQS